VRSAGRCGAPGTVGTGPGPADEVNEQGEGGQGGTTQTVITWAVADDAVGEVAWALMMDTNTCLFSARRCSRPR